MFQRLMLRLMGLEQKPPDPFQGEVGGIAYHVDALPKEFVSIWIDLPRDRMQIEPMLRRRNDEDVKRARFEHFIEALWKYGVQSIDIGFSADKIESVVPAFIRKVDKELAETVAALMVQIRYEALGEQPAYESQRSWSKAAEGTLDLDGQTVTFEFSSCSVQTRDDLAGNLDVMVRTNPSLLADVLSDNLRLALPGFNELVDSASYGQCDDGISDISFGLADSTIGFGDEVREAIKSIEEVDVLWGDRRDQKLATLPCEQAKE